MESKSLESVVADFERAVKKADTKLDHLSWRVDSFELKNIGNADEGCCVSGKEVITNEPSEEEVILLRELLTELNQLKQSYASLRSELQQVHSMHADLTQTLRQKVVQVQDGFSNLRTRFSKHCQNEILN